MRSKQIVIFIGFLAVLGFILALNSRVPQVSAADNAWRARYWNNRKLSGDAVLKRDEEKIDHDWEDGSPGSQVNSDDFSARWTRKVHFTPGTYRFFATMDDGMRVWVDDALVIDSWNDSQVHTEIVDLSMTAGDHELKVEYYEAGGKAVAKLYWTPIAGPSSPPIANWHGEYFNNMTLTGSPFMIRADNEIDFNWKLGSPWPGMNNDYFSVRWTRSVPLDPGRYQFTVLTDDGVRLWVNGALVIDQWHVNQSATFSAEAQHAGGPMDLRLDYYENEGAALVTLNFQKAGSSTIIPPTPQPPGTVPLPDGDKALVVNARWLNVRATPETGDNVVSVALGGEIVTLLGRSGGWIKIRKTNGVEGWVGSSYLASKTDFATLPVVK